MNIAIFRDELQAKRDYFYQFNWPVRTYSISLHLTITISVSTATEKSSIQGQSITCHGQLTDGTQGALQYPCVVVMTARLMI